MPGKTLFAIVLAAGASRRFGSTKQLALLEGTPLVQRAVRSAENICGPLTVLVAGNDWKSVVSAAVPLQGFIVINEEFADGLSTSLRAAVDSVGEVADAILLLLADQPLVSTAHLKDLASLWRKHTGSIVASAYADTTGPPIIFPRRFFPELVSLDGDRGAKGIIDSNQDKLKIVAFEPAAVDIDRPADLDGL